MPRGKKELAEAIIPYAARLQIGGLAPLSYFLFRFCGKKREVERRGCRELKTSVDYAGFPL